MMAVGEPGNALNLDNEERLPWLEPAADFADDEAVSPVRLLILVLTGLALIAAVLGGLWWWQGGGARGQGELIAAQPGPYKMPPTDDGAKNFEGEGDASFAASEGVETAGRVDPARLPEEPAIATAPKTTPPPAKVEPDAQPKGPAPAAKAPVVVSKASPPKAAPPPLPDAEKGAPAPSGAAIQLGAFSSEGSAAKAWTSLTTRFAYLEGLGKSVVPASVGGKTVYRLRAAAGSAAAASEICAKLRVAGESCAVVR
jgi:SPOR domain